MLITLPKAVRTELFLLLCVKMPAFRLPPVMHQQLGALYFWEVAQMPLKELDALGVRAMLDPRIADVSKCISPTNRAYARSFTLNYSRLRPQFCYELEYDDTLMETIHRFCADEIDLFHVEALADALNPAISANLTDPHHLIVLNSRETGLKLK